MNRKCHLEKTWVIKLKSHYQALLPPYKLVVSKALETPNSKIYDHCSLLPSIMRWQDAIAEGNTLWM